MTEQGVRFGDTKIFAVPESMDDLRGPAEGPVTLSAWVYWAPGDSTFDVGTPLGAEMAYTAVLSEVDACEICQVVNADRLREVWTDLILPTRCHERWVQAFPDLEEQ